MATKIQVRRDTAANWAVSAYIPDVGEPCFDLTNGIIKVGDGTNLFTALPAIGAVDTTAIYNAISAAQAAATSAAAVDATAKANNAQSAATTASNAYTDGKVMTLGNAISAAQAAAIASANAYTDTAVDGIQLPEHYKGQLASMANLPATSANSGDYYYVLDLGSAYNNNSGSATWNGTAWDIAPDKFNEIDNITITQNPTTQQIGVAKVPNALTLNVNGTQVSFNGSAAQTVAINPSTVGAATATQGAKADTALQSIPFATSSPAMNGTATVGTSGKVSDGAHVHPTDTSRAPNSHASTATTYGVGSDTGYGHVRLNTSTTPAMNGSAAIGTSGKAAQSDHVHASDTSRVPTSTQINGKSLTGNITLTASDVGSITGGQAADLIALALSSLVIDGGNAGGQ